MKIEKQLQLTSQFAVDGTNVAMFAAQITGDGECNTNRIVIDQVVYRQYRSEVNAAFMEFEDQIFELNEKLKKEGTLK